MTADRTGVPHPSGRSSGDRLDDARTLARHLLAGLPERWQHTSGVARRADGLFGLPAAGGAGAG